MVPDRSGGDRPHGTDRVLTGAVDWVPRRSDGASASNEAGGLRYAAAMSTPRRITSAEILSIGTELLVGETRDTNSGEIAMDLAERGVRVGRIQALPDDLAAVTAAFREATGRAALVVSTGGLGPTPDDLTREAIAAASGETPAVDPDLERWLRGRWTRRGLIFPDINLKQAWLIPAATAIPNEHGSAPGWWVERPGEAIVVALPGPPREMRPMWHGWVRDRLAAAGLGEAQEVRTLRLFGIGESQVAELLGEELLRAANPIVATYARADAVDVRISALDRSSATRTGPAGATARDLADAAEAHVLVAVGGSVWARGRTTWPEALDAALAARTWTLAIREIGTAGSVTALLGSMGGLRHAELGGRSRSTAERADHATRGPHKTPAWQRAVALDSEDVAASAAADVGLAVIARERRGDLIVTVAVSTPESSATERRLMFAGGTPGRAQAALSAAAALLRALTSIPASTDPLPVRRRR